MKRDTIVIYSGPEGNVPAMFHGYGADVGLAVITPFTDVPLYVVYANPADVRDATDAERAEIGQAVIDWFSAAMQLEKDPFYMTSRKD